MPTKEELDTLNSNCDWTWTTQNGVNGYVVKQQNSQDLIEKIEKLLKLTVEERKAMGLAGREKVEREFDRQIVVEKYIEEPAVQRMGQRR